MYIILTTFSAALLALPAFAQDKPEQFATHFTISTDSAAPYYRLSVPLAAYLASAHGDLRDLRVFNGSGQPVPYARLAASGSTEESVQHQRLRWFPLTAAAQENAQDDTDLHVVVKQGSNGSLVEISTHGGSSATHTGKPQPEPLSRGYVLDASQIADRQTVRALELNWATGNGDFQLLDVESSDDLQHWHTLASGVQLARLDYNGARIENRRIALYGFRDRYLRLIWREPASAPTLTDASLELASSRYQSAPLAWSAPITASPSEPNLAPGEYLFKLAQPLPLARLRITLPPGNQLLPLQILAPGHERAPHRLRESRSDQNYPITSSVAYRITSKGREWSNTEIALPGTPLQEFILRIDPRLNPLPQGPQLAYAVQPAQIVFLASGAAPYALATGNPEAKDAALPAATLVPGFGQPDSPEIISANVLESRAQPASTDSTPSATRSPANEKNERKIALWAVLILGVLGMAWMAWSLLRQMNKQPPKS